MPLFALSDLHLSFAKEKPMDVFGPTWRDHPARIERAWHEMVKPRDTVLVAGDLSWAMKLEEALPDLEFLHALPGRKILSKGNHCHWWSSRAKVERVLPDSITLLQNDAHLLEGGVVVAGARGWNMPGSPFFTAGDEKILAREVQRLELSLAAAAKLEGETLVIMTHYPPILADGKESPLAPRIEAARPRVCIYGHLHGKDRAYGFQGRRRGVEYILTSADALDFRPARIL